MAREPVLRNFQTTAAGLRRAAYIGATAISLGLAGISGATAQVMEAQAVLVVPPIMTPDMNSTSPRTVSKAECQAFASYLLDEAREFKNDMSVEFLSSAARFLRADCRATDKNGEINIITMNNRDGSTFKTATQRMGEFDIIGISGVKHCHRPPNGVCPAMSGAASRPAAGG